MLPSNSLNLPNCDADAAFWAEQQKVAIPGWLREDQKEGLHQEGHFALIKQPRSPITKEKEAKRRIPCRGRGILDGDPSHSPPTSVATFGSEPLSFQEIWRVLVTKSAGRK
jgi:hypothetical protein